MDRIESGRSYQIFGAHALKALSLVVILVRRSQMRLRAAEQTTLPEI